MSLINAKTFALVVVPNFLVLLFYVLLLNKSNSWQFPFDSQLQYTQTNYPYTQTITYLILIVKIQMEWNLLWTTLNDRITEQQREQMDLSAIIIIVDN